MTDYLRFIMAFVLVTMVHIDIDAKAADIGDPAQMDGFRHLQFAIEQGEAVMDAYPPRACYAEWWALNRVSLSLLGKAVRYRVENSMGDATLTLDTARTTRWFATRERPDC